MAPSFSSWDRSLHAPPLHTLLRFQFRYLNAAQYNTVLLVGYNYYCLCKSTRLKISGNVVARIGLAACPNATAQAYVRSPHTTELRV
jgi:hypothetical protein